MHDTSRRGRKLALLAAVLLPALACGGPASEIPAETAPTVEAETAAVERLTIPATVELFGTVEAKQTATVSARVMATVTAVRVQPGDAVGRGQLLIEIDPQAAAGQLSQAEGARAQARAGLALATRNYERYKSLAATAAASELELDMARMQYEQAVGAVEQADGAVSAAAAVAADTRVVAPFAGRVVRRQVEIGDLAAPGRPLLTLEAEGSQRLALAVPEGLMVQAGLTLGDALPVRLDSRPDLGTLSAVLDEIAAGADAATHAYDVKAALPVSGIASGTVGRARIEIGQRAAIAVPTAAVLRQGGLSLVVVRSADGHAGSRVVSLGESLADDRVEVLSGLSGDETVALGLSSAPPAGSLLVAKSAAGEPTS